MSQLSASKTNRDKKLVTIRDIAEEVGVTKMTVSLALSGRGRVSPEMRERITEVAQRLNYEPNLYARSLVKGRSNLVGLFSITVYPGVQRQTIEHIQSSLNHRGYDAPLYGHGYREYLDPEHQCEIVSTLCSQQPRAIVCNTPLLKEAALKKLAHYIERGGIVVSFGKELLLPCDHVYGGEEESAHLSAKHLIDLGHTNIGLYCPSPSPGSTDTRFDGFRRALSEARLPTNEKWIWSGPAFEAGGAYLAQHFLKEKKRPTAIVIIGDAAANVFMNLIHRAGIEIPRDLSVIGHHGFPIGEYSVPPLTTVAYPISSTAEKVVEFLCERLDGKYSGPPRQAAMQGKLVVRESTQLIT